MELRGAVVVLKTRDTGRVASVRRWTTTAVDCYKRGCVCEGCFYNEFFRASNQRCQMKLSVLELVRTLGVPKVEAPAQVIED